MESDDVPVSVDEVLAGACGPAATAPATNGDPERGDAREDGRRLRLLDLS